MYIAAPDDIYNVIVPTDKGNLSDIGMGALPSLTGTPAGSLSGGNDYMFAKHDTPAQIEAGIKWHQLRGPDARRRPVQLRQAEGGRVPGRLPRARSCSTARPATRSTSCGPSTPRSTSRTTSRSSRRSEAGDGEPTDAQAVYKTLDPVMLAVLTEPNVNIPALLKTAAANVNTILANGGVTGSRIRSTLLIDPLAERGAGGDLSRPPRARPGHRSTDRRIDGKRRTGVARRAAAAPAATRPAAQVAAPKVRRNASAYGFLIGAVLCFSFFSWYPIVREVIMSFQKPVYGGGYTWAGW